MVIHYTYPVNEQNIKELIDRINYFQGKAESLTINISSLGGSAISGITIYNYLKTLPFPVITRNIGTVESSAMLLYLAGSHRTSADTAKFMIHPIMFSVNESLSYDKTKQILSCLTLDIKNFETIINQETTNLNGKYNVKEYLESETLYFDKTSAYQCGIVTEL